MKKLTTLCMTILIALSLTACAGVPKRDVGLGAGALAGGVAGSAITGTGWGTAIGAVGGGVVGYQVGKSYEHR